MAYKQLASLSELRSQRYVDFMDQLNQLANSCGLRTYTSYSRIWEYPWIWFQLQSLKRRNLRLLDTGSELGPLPWFMATQGFRVIVSDVKAAYWLSWQRACRQLKVRIDKRILDAQNLDLSTASVDIYMSVSVIEHVRSKAKLILEAARVLKSDGLLIMTFDICEPEMGMTFPEWNGRALTMREFDSLFRDSTWFESDLSVLPWNREVIPEYFAWHRTTEPWHNYVTGSVVIKRNQKIWKEPFWKDFLRFFRGIFRTIFFVSAFYLEKAYHNIRYRISLLIKK